MNKSKENDFKEYESLLSDGGRGEARDQTCMRRQIHRPGLVPPTQCRSKRRCGQLEACFLSPSSSAGDKDGLEASPSAESSGSEAPPSSPDTLRVSRALSSPPSRSPGEPVGRTGEKNPLVTAVSCDWHRTGVGVSRTSSAHKRDWAGVKITRSVHANRIREETSSLH